MNIWIPTTKIIEPKNHIASRIQVAGYYKLQVLGADGRLRRETDWFRNLITDAGLEQPGFSGANYNSWAACKVGSGNAAPADSDVSLQSQIASASARTLIGTGTNQGVDRYAYHQWRWRFSTGAAAGNLAEIGVGPTTGNLYSRALIRDSEGDPTTITVLSDEILDVTYEHRFYPPLTDGNAVVDIASVSRSIIIRTASVGSGWGGSGSSTGWIAGRSTVFATAYNGSIGVVTGIPSGTSSGSTESANSTYAGGLSRDFQHSWGISAGNLSGGISALLVPAGDSSGGTLSSFQVGVDPPILKTIGQTLVLNFRQSWARRAL